MKHQTLPIVAGILGVSVASLQAQVLYQDDFDDGTSGSAWTAQLSAADAVANFAFDYSTLGIPSAPNSVGGSTVGMGFLVNQSAGVFQGISASPNGQSFGGAGFRIEFDMWLNYVGPLGPSTVGGSGSTQVGSFGWGTDGSSAQWAGGSSSIMFGATGDGGSSFDYRAYKNNVMLDDASGAYTLGGRNHTFYTGVFGLEPAPAAQVALYPGQTGTTQAGAPAFAWRSVVVEKTGNTMLWYMDGISIAVVDVAGATLSGDNIFFGMFDVNATSSTDLNDFLNTTIIDNIVVSVPEPTTAALALLGGAGLLLRLRRRS